MFAQLLTKSERRKLQIIEMLIHHEHYDLNDVASALSISPQMAQKYMEDLSHEVDFLHIDTYATPHLSLQFAPSYALDELYSYFLSQSFAFQLLEKLFYQSYASYDVLGLELNMSKSSVIRLIKSINTVIQHYGFRIEKKPLEIVGNEVNICQFLTVYFIEKYKNKTSYTNTNLDQELQQMAAQITDYLTATRYFADIKKFGLSIYVHLVRERNGYKLDIPEDFEYTSSLSLSNVRNMDARFIRRINYYVTQFVHSEGKEFDEVSIEIRSIFQKVFNQFDVSPKSIDNHFETILRLYLVATRMSVPRFILNNYLERFLERHNRPLSKAIYKSLREAFIESNLKDKKVEHVHYLFYLMSSFFPFYEEAIIEHATTFKVGLFFDTNLTHTEYVKHQLTKQVPKQMSVTIINPWDRFSIQASTEHYDLILSNCSLDVTEYPIVWDNFRWVDYDLTDQDVHAVEDYMEHFVIEQLSA